MAGDIIDAGQSESGWHRLETYMICPRKFGYSEVLRLEPLNMAQPLALGCALHAGLAAHYLKRSIEDGLNQPGNGAWAYMIPKARGLIQAYQRRYLHEDFKTLAVEYELRVRIKGRLFTRRVDIIFEQNGKVYAMDHKTAGRPQTRFARTWHEGALFTQALLGNRLCEEKFELPWGGMVLNVIGTNGAHFDRRPLFFPPIILDSVVSSLSFWLQQVQTLMESGLSPWDYPQSWQCQGRYSPCDFESICKRGRGVVDAEYRYKEPKCAR